jgi:hypothetical protein
MLQTSNRKFLVPISVSVFVIILGAILKIMHWPFDGETFIIGSASLSFFYLLRFLSKPQKCFLDFVKLGLVISYALRMNFYIFHLPGKTTVAIIFLIFLGLFVVFAGVPYLTDLEAAKKAIKSNNYPLVIKTVILILGAFSIVTGAVFKIMHWPGAGPLLVVGLVIVAVWAIFDLLIAKE